jgi:hypothetical protein
MQLLFGHEQKQCPRPPKGYLTRSWAAVAQQCPIRACSLNSFFAEPPMSLMHDRRRIRTASGAPAVES